MFVFKQQPQTKTVAHISISCFSLYPNNSSQLQLFSEEETRKKSLVRAIDAINDKYGEFTITPALMMNMRDTIVDRIAFGK